MPCSSLVSPGLAALNTYRVHPLVRGDGYFYALDSTTFTYAFPGDISLGFGISWHEGCSPASSSFTGIFNSLNFSHPRVVFTVPLPNSNVAAFGEGVVRAYGRSYEAKVSSNSLEFESHRLYIRGNVSSKDPTQASAFCRSARFKAYLLSSTPAPSLACAAYPRGASSSSAAEGRSTIGAQCTSTLPTGRSVSRAHPKSPMPFHIFLAHGPNSWSHPPLPQVAAKDAVQRITVSYPGLGVLKHVQWGRPLPHCTALWGCVAQHAEAGKLRNSGLVMAPPRSSVQMRGRA